MRSWENLECWVLYYKLEAAKLLLLVRFPNKGIPITFVCLLVSYLYITYHDLTQIFWYGNQAKKWSQASALEHVRVISCSRHSKPKCIVGIGLVMSWEESPMNKLARSLHGLGFPVLGIRASKEGVSRRKRDNNLGLGKFKV